MISIVNILARFIAGRTGRVVGLVAVAGVAVFFMSTLSARSNRISKLPAISLLESVQKMERLDLLKYEANEVLVLGAPSTLQAMLEKAVADTLSSAKKLSELKLDLSKARVDKETVSHNRSQYEQDLNEHRHVADSIQQQYDKLPNTFKKFIDATKNASASQLTATYGTNVAKAYTAYKTAAGEEGKGKRRKRKQEREAANKAERELNKAWLDFHKGHYDKLHSAQKLVKHKEREYNHSTHTRTYKHLSKKIGDYENKIDAEQKSISAARLKIADLKKQLAENAGQADDKKPRILSVLPTSTKMYLDLKTIDTKIYKDSLVVIHLDSLHYDKVDVLVDSSKYYNIAKRKIELQKEANGLYFTVFEQLQVGLEIVEERVKKQMESKHYQDKALARAKDYFDGLYNPLGYQVEIVYGDPKTNTPVKTIGAPTPRPKIVVPETDDSKTILDKLENKAEVAKNVVVKSSAEAKASLEKRWAAVKKATPKNKPKEKPKAVKQDQVVLGIDVSHFQGDVNWQDVAGSDGMHFAYAKATEGETYVDPKFADNWKGIGATSLRRGAYHFYVPTDDPQMQAAFFIKTVGELSANDLPPMVDVEDTSLGNVSIAKFQEDLLIFMRLIEEHYGVQPILYTYTPYANLRLTNPEFAKYKLWLAQYSEESEPDLPNTWKSAGWYMWQYSSKDKIEGVNGFVDVDRLKSSN